MRLKELKNAIENTPVFAPVFMVKTVPSHAEGFIERGDYLVYLNAEGAFATLKGWRLWLGASHIEFMEYMVPKQFFGSTKSYLDAILRGITQPHRS